MKSAIISCLAAGWMFTALLASPICHAQTPEKVPTPAKTNVEGEPSALALRDKMFASYREHNGLHLKLVQKQWSNNPARPLIIEVDFRYEKPNRFVLTVDYPHVDKPGRWQLVYLSNGKNVTVYNSVRNEYQTVKVLANLEKLRLPLTLRCPAIRNLVTGTSPFTPIEQQGKVTYTEAFEGEAGAKGTKLLQMVTLNEGARRTLRYRLDPTSHLIKRFDIRIVPIPGEESPFSEKEVDSTVEGEYTLIDTAPKFAKGTFDFKPPVGAKDSSPAPPTTPEKKDN